MLEGIYLWGLQATIWILVYVKNREPKHLRGAADTAGMKKQQREQERGLRARMKKLIIHLLFRTVNGCRLLARGSAIIWLTANITPRNLFKTALFLLSDTKWQEAAILYKSWEPQVGGPYGDSGGPSLFQSWKQMALFAAVITLPGNISFSIAP